MNWLDALIILVLIYFVYMGTRHGFLIGLLELVGILVSLGVPFFLYVPGGRILERLGVPQVYSGAVAFLIVWFVALNVYFLVARRLYRRLPRRARRSRVNRVLGVIPGIVRGFIIVAILLMIVTAIPIALVTEDTVEGSLLAPPLLEATTVVAASAADVFGEAIHTAFGFVTIEPEADERVILRFRVKNPVIDPAAEDEMLRLVNAERVQRGLKPLVMDSRIRAVARRHSVDMFRRGYFSHDNLDGLSPYERMARGRVRFVVAGENLALAPTVSIAHRGLMQSPGHRANILSPQFERVGIGAARGGRSGIMFTQDFTD